MITCPWCGTSYDEYTSNCNNCGGALPKTSGIQEPGRAVEMQQPSPPPLAPRPLLDNYIWRQMGADGWVVASGILLLLGVIFAPLGLALTVAQVTAFVGLPFLFLGVVFLFTAIPLLILRYQKFQRSAIILQDGEAVLGSIDSLEQNYSVRVNRRHPWIIAYSFKVHGRNYDGCQSTLTTPRPDLHPGTAFYVLYDPNDPTQSLLYPPI